MAPHYRSLREIKTAMLSPSAVRTKMNVSGKPDGFPKAEGVAGGKAMARRLEVGRVAHAASGGLKHGGRVRRVVTR